MKHLTTWGLALASFLAAGAASTARADDRQDDRDHDRDQQHRIERTHDRSVEGVFARRRGYLGFVVLDIGPTLRTHYGAPADAGVLVSDVVAGGPAEKAGVQVGDVLVAVGDARVDSSLDVRRLASQAKEGAEVKLALVRAGKQLTVTATAVERDMPHLMMESMRCLPEIDPEAIREMVERKIVLPRLPALEHRDDLEKRLKELEDRIDQLQKKLQGKAATTTTSSPA